VIRASVEYCGGTIRQALQVIEEKIGQNMCAVPAAARARRVLPRAAGVGLARSRVEEAMRYERRAASA
jgi:hypothetical protein